MKLNDVIYLAIAAALVIMVGQWNKKVGYAVAWIILLGAIVLNIDKFKNLFPKEESSQ